MIDCEKLDDSDQDKNLELHAGRNLRIMVSTLGSKDYHEQEGHLSVGKPQLFSARNFLIMICMGGCHRSVANAESWSNMLTRNGRLLHSVSLPSELNFRKDLKTAECSECSKQIAKFYQILCCFHAECSRLVSTSDSTTEYWKQLRLESLGRRHEESKSLRSTSILTKPAELDMKQDIFSESTERLRNFHECASALTDRLHTGDITGQTDPKRG